MCVREGEKTRPVFISVEPQEEREILYVYFHRVSQNGHFRLTAWLAGWLATDGYEGGPM